MKSKKEPIPKYFNTEEEAAEFWDTHSVADYWDDLEKVEMEINIKKRCFLVSIEDRLYHLAKKLAESKNCEVDQVVNSILESNLATAK